MHKLCLALALSLVACKSDPPRKIEPRGGCLNTCSSNAECRQFGIECPFCNGGRCLQHPITPLAPPDAGVPDVDAGVPDAHGN